ncbi:Leucine-rich_repeat domain superfamily [Hexamita inflata]|uniref:Leucine-rich repeat domain superfamily n=1 Tax=Hexamita inflata TaxID=28002 RepID=A0AA86QZ87_9EUKA|nr:Leucine-rich repeat domain superfamily [Hexamita inflata]CAI9968821.1 Leucine-rich repeat domain superfamily [Hexamita inflata]
MITDIWTIGNLKKLDHLNISQNQIVHVNSLVGNINLTYLDATYNYIEDFSPLNAQQYSCENNLISFKEDQTKPKKQQIHLSLKIQQIYQQLRRQHEIQHKISQFKSKSKLMCERTQNIYSQLFINMSERLVSLFGGIMQNDQ